jgi:hypothetical protein
LPRNRFELACYAIVTKGDAKKALTRMRTMKKIEDEESLAALDMKASLAIMLVGCHVYFCPAM